MRILGSRFLKLLILYQRQLSKMLHGEEGVLFPFALLTKLHSLEILNLVNLKSVCATKPEVWYRLFLLCVVVTNPFNEELLALKRFYL